MLKSNRFPIHFMIFLSIFSLTTSLVFSSSVRQDEQVIYNRADPLAHFKSYDGGYDIRNRHYWASVAFTGVHGYVIGGIWILGGLGFGIFIIVKNYHKKNSSENNRENLDSNYYFILVSLVGLFTILAIVASAFTIAANQNFLWRTTKVEKPLLKGIRDGSVSIKNVVRAMKEVRHLFHTYNESTFSTLKGFTSHKLESESQNLQLVVSTNRHLLHLAIKILCGVTIGLISINMVLVVFALALMLLHWRPGLISIIILCWMLTMLLWFLTGFQFFLYNFVEDTCSAFREYEQNPNENSLSAILPCLDQENADHIMTRIGSTIHKFINKLNSKMTNINQLLGLNEGRNVFSSSGWKICNPFSGAPKFNYAPNNCSNKDTVRIGDIPNVLSRFTCFNSTISCEDEKRFIPEALFEIACSYTQTIQGILNVFPDLRNLTRCTFVKDAFSDVLSNQCRPFKMAIKLLWVPTLSLSIAMIFLEFGWVIKVYQDRGRSLSRSNQQF